jgi:hypothetical protein
MAWAWAVTAAASLATEGVIRANAAGTIQDGTASRVRLVLALAIFAVQSYGVRRVCGVGWATDVIWLIQIWFAASLAGIFLDGAAWAAIWPTAFAAAVLAEVHAVSRWYALGWTPSITHRIARLMAAVDGAGLLLGLCVGFDRIGGWGQVGALGAAGMQALWLYRIRVMR